MEPISISAAQQVLGLGFQGVVIIALVLIAVRLDKRNQTLVDERLEEAKARIEEARAATTALLANTQALNSLTEVVRTSLNTRQHL